MARRPVGAAGARVTHVERPGSTDAVAARVRDANASGTTLRIEGGARWLDAGRPCRADASLSLAALCGITEYEPGDLTLTARAGTTLAELAQATGREGQWLPLEPFGDPASTIGATIATASWGPLASAFGTPRDQLLGCEVVTGTGDVVRAGGRVVKNVAGFDLARLMTGAWGTLGAITEVTVRLRSRPEVERTLLVSLCDTSAASSATTAWRWLRDSPFTPFAAELCSPAMTNRLGGGEGLALLVRLGGNAALVRAAERQVAVLGEAREMDGRVWNDMRVLEPANAAVVRLGTLPSDIGALWATAASAADRSGGYAHATLARGVVRCVVPVRAVEEENGHLRGIVSELQSSGSRVVERLPHSLWGDVPPSLSDPLSAGVKRAFDPHHLLNPGILGRTA